MHRNCGNIKSFHDCYKYMKFILAAMHCKLTTFYKCLIFNVNNRLKSVLMTLQDPKWRSVLWTQSHQTSLTRQNGQVNHTTQPTTSLIRPTTALYHLQFDSHHFFSPRSIVGCIAFCNGKYFNICLANGCKQNISY